MTKWNVVQDATAERERMDREAALNDPEIVALRVAIAKAKVKKELRDEALALDIDVDAVMAGPQMQQMAMPAGMQPPGMMPGGPYPQPGGPGMPPGGPGLPTGMVPGAPMGAPPANLPLEAMMPPPIPQVPAGVPGAPAGLTARDACVVDVGAVAPRNSAEWEGCSGEESGPQGSEGLEDEAHPGPRRCTGAWRRRWSGTKTRTWNYATGRQEVTAKRRRQAAPKKRRASRKKVAMPYEDSQER